MNDNFSYKWLALYGFPLLYVNAPVFNDHFTSHLFSTLNNDIQNVSFPFIPTTLTCGFLCSEEKCFRFVSFKTPKEKINFPTNFKNTYLFIYDQVCIQVY